MAEFGMPCEKTLSGRHDRTICLTKGLFATIHRGHRGKLEAKYQQGNRSWSFTSGEQPGALELRVLQGLSALATIQNVELNPAAPLSEDGILLAATIKAGRRPDGGALLYCTVKTTLYRICIELGYHPTTENYGKIMRSIKRLSHITIDYEDPTVALPMDFLGYRLEKKTGKLLIALNPMVAEAIWGSKQFVHIDMNECRKISTEQTRLLHQHLCAVINPGSKQKFLLSTLASYIWATPSTNASTQRGRERKALIALKELSVVLGWGMEKYGESYTVTRPKILKTHTTPATTKCHLY